MAVVEITISPVDSPVVPGTSVATQVEVRNDGSEVETLELATAASVVGWTTLSEEVLRIWPGDSASLTLTISPPRSPDLPSGEHVVTVRAVARDGSSRESRLPVVVAEYAALDEPQLSPATLETTKQGRIQVTTANRGNGPVSVEVVAEEPTGSLRFDPPRSSWACEAGGVVTAEITASCRKRRLWGAPVVHPYSVSVGAGSQAATVRGTVVQARSASCLPIVLVLVGLGLAALAALALVLATQVDGATVVILLAIGAVGVGLAIALGVSARRLFHDR